MKHLVFIDVDGTLVNHDQELAESAREALTSAVAAGHQLILCTGRGRPEIYPFLWDIGFRGFIGSNGAYGEVDGEVIFNEHMPQEDVAELAAWFESTGAMSFWATGLEVYPMGNFLDLFRPAADGKPLLEGDWSTFLNQIEPYVREGVPATATKVTFFLPTGLGVTLADAQERFGQRFSIIPGSLPDARGETGELTALGMNKSVGLKKMADHLGFALEDTIALGDSSNDIEMLQAAGIGVAMGNGTAGAKAAADWVTSSIDDDGLARAFEKLSLLDS
ncbi:MAG: HAD family hydrolase [Ancrocorticia sp.]